MTTIAVLPGDGIGAEVTAAALRVLRSVRPDCHYEQGLVGAAALDDAGSAYPAATQELCERSTAILFGAVGDPRYDAAPAGKRPESAILRLRKDFDLFANLRPVTVIAGLESASSLRSELVVGLDLVVVRETTSGLYFGTPRGTSMQDGVETAVDTMIYRKPEVERIARVAFELARKRRKRVTSVDKQNVLECGRLWRRTVIEVHAEFPDVELDHQLVDNAAMQLVRDPRRLDVLLTENTFGDILSDEAAMLTGSLGNLPSATLGTATNPLGGRFGLYEPISGSAPDIAGKNIANPIAAILSAALLCRYSLNDEASALRIENAVARTITSGARTRDIARNTEPALSTVDFADVVLRELEVVPASTR
ncbi:MAG TPA: 3-isopropylmalate dehydrogenase [Candidatus Baltobacteraceae bacterium]|jgi:3-isopropylmalate dehydrogenase|nr:3-isopropylmalate dehydrogenase [Candidatus Baltobacteraceae bacterium]